MAEIIESIEVRLPRCNIALLDDGLRGLLGAKFAGLSRRGEMVQVHLVEALTKGEREQLGDALLAHNPSGETADQRSARLQKEALVAARVAYGELVVDPEAQQPDARLLARKLYLLELELLALFPRLVEEAGEELA